MNTVKCNMSGRVRRETLHGREYLVAPLVMLTPGVHAGSRGAMLYPSEELAANPEAWNHTPLVVGHPRQHGLPISARDPKVLNRYGIGFVFRARHDGKLKGEGWFDVEAMRRIAPSVLSDLQAGNQIELSTGLSTDEERKRGTYNGRAYNRIARNYVPDHLAILPDAVGACSLQDGCGVLANESSNILEELRMFFEKHANEITPNHSNDVEGEPLILPTINWSEETPSRKCNCKAKKPVVLDDDGDVLLMPVMQF